MKTKFAFRSLVAACNTEISVHSPGTTQHDQPKTTVLNTEAFPAPLEVTPSWAGKSRPDPIAHRKNATSGTQVWRPRSR